MSRSHFRPVALKDCEGDSIISSTLEDGYAETTSTPSSATLLSKSQKAPNKSWFQSYKFLRLLSLILHPTLVAIHLVLVVIWAKGLENRIIFSLENQKIVTFLITAISTTFGVIYSAVLVFVTQTLSTRCRLRMDETLTATHDSLAAWSGMGSAMSQLWNQKSMPASMFGVLSVFLYLGNILALHITTPALFSLETFNSSRSIVVGTQSLPAFDWSRYNLTDEEGLLNALTNVTEYVEDGLFAFPSIVGSTTNLGLSDGTLYDVLNSTQGIGNATVDATGFNITCGYMTDASLKFFPGDHGQTSNDTWEISWKERNITFDIYSTQPGVITSFGSFLHAEDYIFIYSTIPIIDSNNNTGSWLNLTTPMHSSVSSIQVLQCSLTVVAQMAIVDSQSRQIFTVEPTIKKTASEWLPYKNPEPGVHSVFRNAGNDTTRNLLLDAWTVIYGVIPISPLSLDFEESDDSVDESDLYLIEKLHLLPPGFKRPHNVTLHEVENGLSEIVAAMFWTVGRIPPRRGPVDVHLTRNNTVTAIAQQKVNDPPILLQGNAMVTEISTQARLDLSIIAIAAGLAASIALMLLSLQFSLLPKDLASADDIPIDGTGILHSIWLYRSHPELEILLRQVEHPTNQNLREAGMIRTRLVGRELREKRAGRSLRGWREV
ncbi:hypothetical protein C8R44DRAFT_857713 [Mycena epipterygia]|nr:hypothetical protein C8R44DRAFT_857713 [Mycena epipterygia]